MKSAYLLALAIAAIHIVSLSPLPVESQELPATFRGSAPRIEEIRSSATQTYSRRAKYYFTITLPDTTETPLQKVVIQQRGGQEPIRFKLEETIAFIGTSRDRGQPLRIQRTTYDGSALAVMVELEQAVSPGTTLSVRLKPRRNPRWSGAYGFGVAVFPPGENARELYLGARRLTFYDRFPRRIW